MLVQPSAASAGRCGDWQQQPLLPLQTQDLLSLLLPLQMMLEVAAASAAAVAGSLLLMSCCH
jgi:hypothetical protein